MEKYIKALKEHWYTKKERDDIFAKIKNCNISIDIKSLPLDCHSCQFKNVGVDDRRCIFAGLCFDNTTISRGERLKYCPLEIKIKMNREIKFRAKTNETAQLNIDVVSNCLYAFFYNSCIHESSWAMISLHYTKAGAEKAMQKHKQKALDEFNEMYAGNNEFEFKFGEHEDWRVEPVKVLP